MDYRALRRAILGGPPMKGATGCEMGVTSRTVEGRNGGTLTPHPPGSNGASERVPSGATRCEMGAEGQVAPGAFPQPHSGALGSPVEGSRTRGTYLPWPR